MSLQIKIYVSCHKDLYSFSHPVLYPIQVGTALAEFRYKGMQYDDSGDNISTQNRSYCELTAQYWAWKNDAADYYGFFHYRRYLSFDPKSLVDHTNSQKVKRSPLPYRNYKLPDEQTLNLLGYTEENIKDIIGRYDIIAPLAEQMHVSVYDHYKKAPFHHIEDLDLVLKIIEQRYPEFKAAAQEYMAGTKHYFCNMFVMKRELFFNYCAWLFSILQEFDRQTDFTKYSGKACRVDGYLGERLFGVYYTWLKKQSTVRWAELPRVHFEAFPGETDNFWLMKRVNMFLPPGTRRRAYAKKLLGLTLGRRNSILTISKESERNIKG